MDNVSLLNSNASPSATLLKTTYILWLISVPNLKNLMVISVYLLSLLVAHMSDVPGRWLVVTGDSARIQYEITQSSAWFFNVLGV